jgi:hypothetical protein
MAFPGALYVTWLPLIALCLAAGGYAVYASFGRRLLGWAGSVLVTPFVWCGIVALTLDMQIITISGNGESIWSVAGLLFGLPWAWLLVGSVSFVATYLDEAEALFLLRRPNAGRASFGLVALGFVLPAVAGALAVPFVKEPVAIGVAGFSVALVGALFCWSYPATLRRCWLRCRRSRLFPQPAAETRPPANS